MSLKGYIICLFLTVVIEAAAWRFGLRRRENMADICLMNLATNPLANMLLLALLAAPFSLGIVPATGITEALVIASEWAMLRYIDTPQPLKSSIVLNCSSYIIGMAILKIFNMG